MITVISQTTQEVEEEFQEEYKIFKEQCYNTNKLSSEIKQEMGLKLHCSLSKKLSQRWNQEEPYDLSERQAMVRTGKWLKWKTISSTSY